jgi:hypothetical protein
LIETETQHWVPKFLLRNFASSDGRVYFYDIKDRIVGKRPPKQLASRPNFNQLIVGGEPRSFEGLFERIETAAAPVISRVISEETLSSLAVTDRIKLSRFVAAQSFRTDAYRLGLRQFGGFRDIGSAVSAMIDSIEPLSMLIAQRHWGLMRSSKGERFLLGDSPLILQRTENPSDGGSLGFDVPGVEALIPLSPRFALWMPSSEIGEAIVNGYWQALRTVIGSLFCDEYYKLVTPEHFAVAERCLQTGHSLYRALRLGDAFDAEPDNVINLNAQQIFFASAQVY